MTEVFQQAFNAASSASVYLLVAVGLTIMFGLSRLINIAYGDFMTLGAYVTFIVAGEGGLIFIWGFAVATLVMAVLNLILYQLLFKRTMPVPITGFLISLGLVQIIENGLNWHYNGAPIVVKGASNTVWIFGGVDVSVDRVIIIVGTIIIAVALILFLDFTRTGLAIRAIATDREAAALMGVPVNRLVGLVFTIGGLLAGAGGAFIALLEPPTPTLGAELVLKGFVVALVGGLGSVRGAIVGAIALAITEAILIGVNLTSWLDALEFGAVIGLLLFRPQGLLGGLAHSM